MVWFEPERVHINMQSATEHPGWVLGDRNDDKDDCLFNLGNPRKPGNGFRNILMTFIKKNGIDYSRQDFNIRPAPFLTANGEPGRTSMKEIRYIEGLYAYWDYLLNRFPYLLIDIRNWKKF